MSNSEGEKSPSTGLPNGSHQSSSPRRETALTDHTSINLPIFLKFSLMNDIAFPAVAGDIPSLQSREAGGLEHHSTGSLQGLAALWFLNPMILVS
jgi:hypothetical protein